ncbi:hypothetical protein ACFPZN_25950, partial [Actinomadura rugatobispora]
KAVGYRAGERFPFNSMFKAYACAAVLRKARDTDATRPPAPRDDQHRVTGGGAWRAGRAWSVRGRWPGGVWRWERSRS